MSSKASQKDPLIAPALAASKTTTLTDRLVTAIAVGAYSPGERLPPERELAATLAVSRDTLRTALKNVADLGLIEARRGRGGGNFVSHLAWEEVAPGIARRTLEVELPKMAALFDYRCMIEGTIARAAAERRTTVDVTAIRHALDEFRATDSMIEARAADRRLHGTITAASHNPHLATLSAQLTAAATLGFGAEPYEPHSLPTALAHHEELVDHVVRGEVEQAGRTAQLHFAITLEIMQTSLRRAASLDR